MIHAVLVFNDGRDIRLEKWYSPLEDLDRADTKSKIIAGTFQKDIDDGCNVFDLGNLNVVFKKFCDLFFCFLVDRSENELVVMEMIKKYVCILDSYIGGVCEIDMTIKAASCYALLDRFIVAGALFDPNIKSVVQHYTMCQQIEQREKRKPRKA